MGQRPIKSNGFKPTPLRAQLPHPNRTNLSAGKGPGYIKGNFVPHDVVTRPCQFMRHGLDGHDPIGLGLLSLIEAADLWVKPHRKVGCFHKGPGQVLVAVLGVPAPLALAIAQLLAPHAATIGREVSDTGKSLYLSSLQHDGEGQDLSDAVDRFEVSELWPKLNPLLDHLLQLTDLFFQTMQHPKVALCR